MDEQRSPIQGLSQGKTFALGLLAGFLVLCTIGFFILLSKQMDDDSYVNTNTAPAKQVEGNIPTAPVAISVAPVEKDEHIRGAKNAKITLIEYSDFECPFCQRFQQTVSQVLKTYPNDVRVVYRHLPLRSIHQNAAPAALASECAGDQGKFWEFHDELFVRQAELGDSLYTELAKQFGLNMTKFAECLSSNKFASAIQEDEKSAQAAGGQGTPYSILIGQNGETVPVSGAQPFSVLDLAIKEML